MQIKHLVNGEWVEVRQNKVAEAFDHAKAHGSQFDKNLYKVATNVQGHVTQATPVTKTDLTDYGLLDTNAVAPLYSNDTTYSTGEFCIYEGKLYKALQNVDHEEFNPSKWEESNILTATIGGGIVITGEADWNAQQGELGYIKNKPDVLGGIPRVYRPLDASGVPSPYFFKEDIFDYEKRYTYSELFDLVSESGLVYCTTKAEVSGIYGDFVYSPGIMFIYRTPGSVNGLTMIELIYDYGAVYSGYIQENSYGHAYGTPLRPNHDVPTTWTINVGDVGNNIFPYDIYAAIAQGKSISFWHHETPNYLYPLLYYSYEYQPDAGEFQFGPWNINFIDSIDWSITNTGWPQGSPNNSNNSGDDGNNSSDNGEGNGTWNDEGQVEGDPEL